MSTRPSSKFVPQALLMLVDGILVYGAFVAALKIRFGFWDLLASDRGLGTAALISVAVYMVTLSAADLYRQKPSRMHLDAFLKTSGFMLVGAAVSLALMYLTDPSSLPPRSIVGAQCAFAIIGVLGLRAIVRFTREKMSHGDDGKYQLDLGKLQDRRPVAVNEDAVRDYLTGRTVLVTGAGGSVGSVLTDRLMRLNPFRLVLVDVSEYALFRLENNLRKRRFDGELVFRIADVRDEAIMRTTFAAYHPEVVFHAAAYKHVPLMERHPVEAFANNTLATVSLARTCEQFGTEQFIFVSTDKAVEPNSVLGATKRLAEWYIRSIDSPMRCKSIRFGNVLNSQGSVVPTFVDQIRRGGPVTVTHPDMERYFMTADDAASLILATLLLDEAATFTARMGSPVSITELANYLITEIAAKPGRINITFTGLRPGEKLSEQLWSKEESVLETANDTIVGIQSPAAFSRTELDTYFRNLEELCSENRTAELRKALFNTRLHPITVSHSDA